MTCKICNGLGKIPVDDLTVKECICSFARSLRQYLGPEIASAADIEESPLYGQADDLSKHNLFVKSWWQDFLPHFKYFLMHKSLEPLGLQFKFNIITDEWLRTVYLGAESHIARARARSDEAPLNSLHDVMDEKYHLVVVRLGFLCYKNVAMPSILKEALMIRETQNLATWIVETPNSVWGPGHRSYDTDVGEYVHRNFTPIAFEGTKRDVPAQGIETTEIVGGISDVSSSDLDERPVAQPKPVMVAERSRTYDLSKKPQGKKQNTQFTETEQALNTLFRGK